MWRDVLDEAREAGVHGVINIAVDVESSREALRQAKLVPDRMRVTVGYHPHEADHLTPDLIDELRVMAREESVVAIGEIGLDYHYLMSAKADQIKAFWLQMGLASEMDLPVVIHSREAEGEVVSLIGEIREDLMGGVLHCYTGGLAEAGKAISMGFYISFTGIVTFGDGSMDDLVRYVPLENLLLETDSPYLAPVPYRGKTNTPVWLPIIADRIAELKGISLDELISVTSKNARELFGSF
jgi:TatD DNase family protein